MKLPQQLLEALDREAEPLNLQRLTAAREELTKRYREPSGMPCMTTEAQRMAYLFSRLPATYAACDAALHAIKAVSDWQLNSLLDLGSGPGTAMWAAIEHFPELAKSTLIEKDPALVAIGKRLALNHPAHQRTSWQIGDLEQMAEFLPHDLVILSYSVGELKSEETMLLLIEKAWQAANKLLLIVEPGTPAGFERIRLLRRHLIHLGAQMVAPCPHMTACPTTGTDWCHFSARVERTSLHRRLKGGSLAYEDEKFSYVAVAKEPVSLPQARILSEPSRHSGHVTLKLCTKEQGLQFPTISKKHGDLYKLARKSSWGDNLERES